MQTDEELIRGCLKRHPASQEALYRRYWGFAMSVCLRYTPSREDALEICHDAFLNVFSRLDRYDPERPFRTWFRRIIVNAALDRYRSTRRHHATFFTEDDSPEAEMDAAHSITLEADEILALLRALPEVQRLVFNLYEVEGYAHDEIAGMLGIAPGTSRSHLTRARRHLAALYHQHMNGVA